MDKRLRTDINRLTVGFLEEIIQIGGVAYTKESAENELKRRKKEEMEVANKYIGKYYVKIDDESISVYKFTDNILNRELVYEFIQFNNTDNYITCTKNDDCREYVENIDEMIEDYKEISEKEYNKYVEIYNKISEFVNQIIMEYGLY